MSNRYQDWFRQAQADLQHARHSLKAEDYEWSCFAAHQAAEKGLKAVFMQIGMDAWGHTLSVLVGNLPDTVEIPAPNIVEAALVLDKYYIPTRYPNGFDSGAPTDFYTQTESASAIQLAEAILEYCQNQIR